MSQLLKLYKIDLRSKPVSLKIIKQLYLYTHLSRNNNEYYGIEA